MDDAEMLQIVHSQAAMIVLATQADLAGCWCIHFPVVAARRAAGSLYRHSAALQQSRPQCKGRFDPAI